MTGTEGTARETLGRTEDEILQEHVYAEEERQEGEELGEESLDGEDQVVDAVFEDPQVPEAQVIDLDEPQVAVEQPQVPAEQPTNEELLVLIAQMSAQLEKLKSQPKNQVAGKPSDKVYVRLGDFTGKAPRQQQNLAAILTAKMPLRQRFTEAQVFKILNEATPNYESLRDSRQDVTYLFRYYRGLKDTGFIGRGFLRTV